MLPAIPTAETGGSIRRYAKFLAWRQTLKKSHVWSNHECDETCSNPPCCGAPVVTVWRDKYWRCPIVEAHENGTDTIGALASQVYNGMGVPVYPYGGGLLTQPGYLMDAINTFRSEQAKYEDNG